MSNQTNPNAFRVLNADGTEPDFEEITREEWYGRPHSTFCGFYVSQSGSLFVYYECHNDCDEGFIKCPPGRFRVEPLNQPEQPEQPRQREELSRLDPKTLEYPAPEPAETEKPMDGYIDGYRAGRMDERLLSKERARSTPAEHPVPNPTPLSGTARDYYDYGLAVGRLEGKSAAAEHPGRPCEVAIDTPMESHTVSGHFHLFTQDGNALIEDANGQMHDFPGWQIHFTDRHTPGGKSDG